MNGETINQAPLVRSLGSQDANAVRENNTSNRYFWMLNKHGRKVPVSVELEKNALARGFVHTDRVVCQDNPKDQVIAPVPLSPLEAVAKMAEKMSESSEVTAKVLEEVTGVKRKGKGGRPPKKDVEVETTVEEES